MIILIIKALYKAGLRDVIVRAIANPEERWDDTVLNILDILLECNSRS